MDPVVVDVGEADFEREVLLRSDTVPVVVDFWAPWCGPCRVLGPILERLAEEHAGAFVLARVNVDEAPQLAEAFQVRTIPSVKAIRERGLLGGFEGAQPEPVVRRFVETVLPTPADRLAREGEAAWTAGDTGLARARWEEALALDARHPDALLGLARLDAEGGDVVVALDRLDRIGPGHRASEEAVRLAAELRTRSGASGDEAELRARIGSDERDTAARVELGRLLAAQGRHEEALETLLEAVRRDPHYDEDAARRAMLDLFAVLGPDDPLTARFRAALARALFR